MEVRKPAWSTSSFLLYAGGLTVLGSATGALGYLATQYGRGALVAWTLLPLGVLAAVAHWFRRRDEWVAAGLFAVAAVAMWAAFVGTLFDWWGWLPGGSTNGPFEGWNWGAWLLVALVIAAAAAALRIFRFPLLVVFVIEGVYYLVTDILSNGGNWTAVVTLLVGLAFLLAGVSLDGGHRRAYGFWYHLASGLTIGGALLYWWHSSETDWALVATTAVAYVAIAAGTRRSTWAVLGVIGFAAAATHWTIEWMGTGVPAVPGLDRAWVPSLVFGVVGFFFVLLGLLAGRRRAAVT